MTQDITKMQFEISNEKMGDIKASLFPITIHCSRREIENLIKIQNHLIEKDAAYVNLGFKTLSRDIFIEGLANVALNTIGLDKIFTDEDKPLLPQDS